MAHPPELPAPTRERTSRGAFVSPRSKKAAGREPLSRERIVAAGIELADEVGIDSLSMRKLGRKLGVEAMSLYHHVAHKDDLLDGMVDVIFDRIGLPEGENWRDAMRRRALSVRATFRRHRWAVGLLESRENPGEASFRHIDGVVGVLREAGFSMTLVAHAYALLDSYIYGFVLQENAFRFEGGEEAAELAATLIEAMPSDAYPNLVAFTREHVLQPGYDFAHEFEYGLDLILDGLERRRAVESGEG